MRVLGLAAVATIAAATPALGQGAVPPPGGVAVPPGAIVAAPEGGLFISPVICAALAAAPADLVPDVDRHGRPVAPADLPEAGRAQHDVAITVAPELRRRYGVMPSSRLARGQGVIGYVTIGSGQPYLNGMPLAPDERALLRAACQQAKH